MARPFVIRATLSLAVLATLAAGCAGQRPIFESRDARPRAWQGMASWYGGKYHGRRTASGEIYDMHALTAAHRTLPFGVIVRVTNLENGRSVEVRITDRGPFKRGRIIDLSYAAALELEMIGPGVVPVRVVVVDG